MADAQIVTLTTTDGQPMAPRTTDSAVAYTGTGAGSASTVRDAIDNVSKKVDDLYTYGTVDMEAGTTNLETGKLYFVYE